MPETDDVGAALEQMHRQLDGYLMDSWAIQTIERHTAAQAQEIERLEAEHAKLMSMVEKAASTLRELADMDDEGSPRLMVCAGEAKRTLKAMREIGGIE